MEKKNNNGVIIILMGVIIIILGGFCILFVTGIITFNKNIDSSIIEENTNDNVNEKNDLNNTEEENGVYLINYEEESYTTKNFNNVENSNNKRNVVRVENKNNEVAANLIETKLNEISNKVWGNIKKKADDCFEMPYTELGATYLFETGEITENRLTFIAKLDGGFGGGGWISDEGYNFDATTGVLLNLTDLGSGVLDYVYNQSVDKIEKLVKGDSCFHDDWKLRVKEELTNDGNWYFTNNGIKIVFQKYSIACGAGGITYVDIDKNDINQYLRDEYKIK